MKKPKRTKLQPIVLRIGITGATLERPDVAKAVKTLLRRIFRAGGEGGADRR